MGAERDAPAAARDPPHRAGRQRHRGREPPLVDTLDSVDLRTGGDNPLLRRGYARALQMLADPTCPVRGVVAVSRTAITSVDRLYQDQLT
ncbi:hypothetical protein [Streptomyces candidus]|uniref:Uncharacterized protein n=1 Tax=Streptomyces candidus TaxID=67283 RepID=A0A7X0HL40_9ACTN|nr:hypothetical protein [Streptomyces candidus]MBB6439675.1 hypothetical protein [Streptomyces candidus]GHH56744.1 hypothetical protein GCM10018773_63170 [Streptomyces candidus]